MIQRMKVLFSVLLALTVVFVTVHILQPQTLEFLADYLDTSYREQSEFQTTGALRCDGKWTTTYKDYQAKSLRSSSPDRKFLVYYCRGHSQGCGGYGNRMMGIISTFYLAVVMNRTFLIHWGGPERLEAYYKPNMIDWTYDERKLKGLKSRTNRWGMENFSGYQRQVVLREKNFLKWAETTHLLQYLDAPVENIATIWYFAHKIWDNPHLKRRAAQLGIPIHRSNYPYGMIGCAMKFLFKKTRYLHKALTKAKAALSTRQRPFIGIHIRTNDHHFGKNNKDSFRTRDPRAVFACAQRVENALKRKNRILKTKTFTWVLAADDKKVKLEALRRYPNNVVTLDINPLHIEHSTTGFWDIFRDLLLDQLLLLECDYFLPTWDSTFSYMVIGTRQFPQKSFVFGERCRLDERSVALTPPPTSPPVKKKPV